MSRTLTGHPRGSIDCRAVFANRLAATLMSDATARLLRALATPMLLAIALCLGVVAVPAHAQTALPPAPYADRQLDDPALEAKATALMHTIRCLTCQSQSIADSNASMASDMRSEIRERIARGEEPEAIRAWLIERYGDWISYKPTAEPILWPLWGAPLLLLGAGGALAFRRIRRHRRKEQS